MPCRTDKTIPPKAMTTGTTTTDQIWLNETRVRSYPLWDGIHDESLDLEAIQISEATTPTIGIVALSSSSQSGIDDHGAGYQLLYDVLGNQEMMTKTTAETTSHKTVG